MNRRAMALALAGLLVAALVGVAAPPASASHCWPLADVERQRDGDVGGYHSLSCNPASYRLRIYYEGLHCNSRDRIDCFDPKSSAHIVYSGWKECFNTMFCRVRRAMANAAAPGSWFCVYTQGLIEKRKGGDIERTGRAWKCEYMR